MIEYSMEGTVEGRWDEYYNGRMEEMKVEMGFLMDEMG